MNSDVENENLNIFKEKKSKRQSARLTFQHLESGGVSGIFGDSARKLDGDIKPVIDLVLEKLKEQFPNLQFRCRLSIKKEEIHKSLNKLDPRLGTNLFVSSACIRPDGKITEVKDIYGDWRIILIGECKFQGKDIENIKKGERTQVMEKRGQYIMPAGNAIERAHKNIQEIKNLMINEKHFPYVILLQGSNFATREEIFRWPDGTSVTISPNSSMVNRIDRVTASNYGMVINKNYCKNIKIHNSGGETTLQVASIYAQAEEFNAEQMLEILWDVTLTSLEVLSAQLPKADTKNY